MPGPTYASKYLASGMTADSFVPFGFGAREDRANRVEAAAKRRVSPELLRILAEQQQVFGMSPARQQALDDLALSGTVAVVTGQQTGVLLGPLYTLYKAVSAVLVARLLQRETSRRCVPIFWLQTEDHDFEEIATVRTWCGAGLDVTTSLPVGASTKTSVAQRRLGPEISEQLAQVFSMLESSPAATEVRALVAECYRPGVLVADAFARVLATLFADEGLLIFSPRDPRVAHMAQPVFEWSVLQRQEIESALAKREALLEQSSISVQVRLRPGSPLCFFHHPTALDGRSRFEVDADDVNLLPNAGTLKYQQLLDAVKREPFRFSTSALLRPLFQDWLFPTAAYVGGAAEVGYFAQLMPLYGLLNLEPPLVVPRDRFRLVPKTVRRALDSLGLTTSQFEQLSATSSASAIEGMDSTPSAEWLAELQTRLTAFQSSAAALDPALARAVQRTEHSIARAMDRLSSRYRRTLRQRDADAIRRRALIQHALLPQGQPQERMYSFVGFAAETGLRQLMSGLFEQADPLQTHLKEVRL
jgi:bacillithiol synthase